MVSIYSTGIYTFIKTSSITTVGYFYSDRFDPSYPDSNLIGSYGNAQSLISLTLEYGRTYILVITTYRSSDVGSFIIQVHGPKSVGLTSFRPSTSK